ncbi:MAG: H+/Na+-translocating ferredoxin:NAD+ oxidoreductase subunit [Candidatus Poribacteria bacterium]|nr:H+/Na+-translocating ferredoxin:NAD+ oxidoreductase subunit [Candidatus Poribacteria bacterium]
MKLWQEFTKGIIEQNPILRLVLGTCPTLAVTTMAVNGMAMGLAVIFVLIGSNVVVSLIRKVVPDKVRIPVFVVVIASFVTAVDLFMAGFFYELHKVLGIFIPLIVVNCIILARAEAFASKNNILRSILDALGMGVGYMLALTIIGSIRELLGNGTIFGFDLLHHLGYQNFLIMILPPGAFIVLGLMIGLLNLLTTKYVRR